VWKDFIYSKGKSKQCRYDDHSVSIYQCPQVVESVENLSSLDMRKTHLISMKLQRINLQNKMKLNMTMGETHGPVFQTHLVCSQEACPVHYSLGLNLQLGMCIN
jgi:hypothetical protein